MHASQSLHSSRVTRLRRLHKTNYFVAFVLRSFCLTTTRLAFVATSRQEERLNGQLLIRFRPITYREL